MRGAAAAAVAGVVLLTLCVVPSRCLAMYQLESEEYGLDIRGALNAGAGLVRLPGGLAAERLEKPWSADLRLLVDGYAGDLRAEVNILQNIRSALHLSQTGNIRGVDVERSALLFRQQKGDGNSRADLVVDALNLSWGNDNVEVTLGRQPIQLSVTSSLTPNDFFAPFAPQHFYRVYKPGVDAVRYMLRLAEMSQLSLIGVLGYAEDPETDNGWSAAPDWQRTSILARYVYGAGSVEWGGLAGLVREDPVIGFSLQGELTDWLGLRAEGHCRAGSRNGGEDGCKASAGVEHRFANSLTVRLEQMHSSFNSSSQEFGTGAADSGRVESGLLGRDFSAVSLGYEFSPLLSGEFLFLRNWADDAQSFSLYAVYSLADEAELALQATVPAGNTAFGPGADSASLMQPASFVLEYRRYF